MSDTITPEERASWRERLENPFICHYSKHGEFTLRLLNALEITEALLDESCQETRANFSAVYQACTEIIPDLKSKLEAAETEVARLREVLTAVEEIALAAPELNMNNYDEDQVSTLNEAMIGVCGILLKEAARRTVVGES